VPPVAATRTTPLAWPKTRPVWSQLMPRGFSAEQMVTAEPPPIEIRFSAFSPAE
jgi:hypothetical protein